MLGSVLRDLMRGLVRPTKVAGPVSSAVVPGISERRRVLNVGGASKDIPIPSYYEGWDHLLLDIDPRVGPDIVCDARELSSLGAGQFDAVYCSHNLEHYYRHHVASVLQGFLHVLRPDGFVDIRVPDINGVMRRVVESGMDLGDVLYESNRGPIAAIDVVYGLGREIESSGNDYYAHKTGFTARLLGSALQKAGFTRIIVSAPPDLLELQALAFKSEPTGYQRNLLSLPAALA